MNQQQLNTNIWIHLPTAPTVTSAGFRWEWVFCLFSPSSTLSGLPLLIFSHLTGWVKGLFWPTYSCWKLRFTVHSWKAWTVLTAKFFSAALELFVHITWSSSARRNERNDDLFSFSSRARPEDKHNRWKSACDQIWPRLCFSDRSDDLFNSKLKSILGNFFWYFISFIVQAFLPARRRMFKELRLLWSEYLNHRRRRRNSPSPSSPASRRTCYYLFLHLVVIMLSSVFPSHSPFHSSLVKSRLMKHNSKL